MILLSDFAFRVFIVLLSFVGFWFALGDRGFGFDRGDIQGFVVFS